MQIFVAWHSLFDVIFIQLHPLPTPPPRSLFPAVYPLPAQLLLSRAVDVAESFRCRSWVRAYHGGGNFTKWKREKNKKTLPFGLFTLLFFTNASLSSCSSAQWLGQTSNLTLGNVMRVKIISSGWWQMERGGSGSAWTLHRGADFERLQCAPKGLQVITYLCPTTIGSPPITEFLMN